MSNVRIDKEQLESAMEKKLFCFRTKIFHQLLGLGAACTDIRVNLVTFSSECGAIRLTADLPDLGCVISTLTAVYSEND